jgi:serine/threonine protein kinase
MVCDGARGYSPPVTLTDTPDLRICPLCDRRISAPTCPADGHATVRPDELVARRVADPLLGATIEGKYQIETRIGVGSMGAVYRALHLRTGSAVAIKVMHAAMAESGAAVRRFLLEAQNAGKLDHPHVVRVLDRGETAGGLPYLVMELVDGRTLDAVLADGPLPPERVVAIALQIVKGLGGAHRRGLVHRDVKPENVMLVDVFGEDVHVKLLDFGIARAAAEQAVPGTMVLGTPRYMAPEQWNARAALDARSDLYSLGCVLYHMIAGRPPFLIDTPDPRRVVQLYQAAHMTELPPPLPIPAASPLAMLVDDLLRKDPAQRPPSAEEVLRRLRLMAAAPLALPERSAPTWDDRATMPEGDHPGVVVATVLLPIDQADLTVEAPAPIHAGPGADEAAPEPDRTLLLVDDDAPTRALLSPAAKVASPPPAVVPAPALAPAPPADVPEAPSPASPPPAVPRPAQPGRRIQNVETAPPPLPTGLNLPASAASTPTIVTPPKRRRMWLQWLIGLVVAVALGIGLGAILGSL